MKQRLVVGLPLVLGLLLSLRCGCTMRESEASATVMVTSRHLLPDGVLRFDHLFFETSKGRTFLPAALTAASQTTPLKNQLTMPDGRTVRISLEPVGDHFSIRLNAEPDADIVKWGLAIEAQRDEYYTGLMERVVDGPQEASWKPGIEQAMNLHGQRVEMLLKPTTSVYAPFYLSSRGYAVFVKGTFPGFFDFGVDDPERVTIEFEGPSFEMMAYTADNPAALISAHALDAGPPFLPPKWAYSPWRWRDEHSQRPTYYDGTPVSGPFNAEVMEDVLMMKAYGIPNGVYWIDRPWGRGTPWGYDDFEIDEKRLPHFATMVRWLNAEDTRLLLWIAPFYQGTMMEEALAKGYALEGQERRKRGSTFPIVDMTNPAARSFWQDGVAKLLKLGVAGFKLDRGEEHIPESGPYKVFDGRSIREARNAYPPLFVEAAYEVAQRHRGDDFVLMPRAAYTGSAPYAVFWGGDIGATQEGLRASIIAVQRAAVMGYPNWGSDTCGYSEELLDREVCGRWLAFSAFTPIMEVGPTLNVGFWNLPRDPNYDATLIATWRLYARLHQRLSEYSYRYANEASVSGMPIVRPLFLVDPKQPQAWNNWWTYLYGPDIVVSPIWEKGTRSQEAYLPSGAEWRDAWQPKKTYQGGQTVTVTAEAHQIPLFIRVGSEVDIGDLTREWQESLRVAQQKPDLKSLDAEVTAWFEKNNQNR